MNTFPPFVGREAELAKLTRLPQASTLTVIHGPSGVGKSRLLAEVRRRLGGRVLHGRCTLGQPYFPLVSIVHQAASAHEVELEGLACAQGCHSLWYQHQGAETPLGDAYAFQSSVGKLLSQLHRPIIALTDIDFLDQDTVHLLRFLREAGVGVPVVGTAMSLPSWSRDFDLEEVSLGPLSRSDVAALLSSPAMVEEIWKKTQGDPSGIAAVFQSTSGEPEDSGTAALLEALAVLNAPADLEQLSKLIGSDVDAQSRNRFAQHRSVRQSIVDGRVLYGFVRERERTSRYLSLDDSTRKRLHSNAALTLTSTGAVDLAAHHALQAEKWEVVVPVALAAANALAGQHAVKRAASLLEQVLLRAPGNVDCSALRRLLIHLYERQGECALALGHLPRAIDSHDVETLSLKARLLSSLGKHAEARQLLRGAQKSTKSERQQAAVLTQLAEADYQQGNYARATGGARQVLDDGAADRSTALWARNILGKCDLGREEPELAIRHFQANLDECTEEASHDSHEATRARTNIAVSFIAMGRLDEAVQTLEEAGAHPSDLRDDAIVQENLAVCAHLRSDFSRALAGYQRALLALKRLGHASLLARCAINLCDLLSELGDFAGSEAMILLAEGCSTTNDLETDLQLRKARSQTQRGEGPRAREALAGLDHQDAILQLVDLELDEGNALAAQRLLEACDGDALPLLLRKADVQRALGQDSLATAQSGLLRARERGAAHPEFQAMLRIADAQIDAGHGESAGRTLKHAHRLEASLLARIPNEMRDAWAAGPDHIRLDGLDGRFARATGRTPSQTLRDFGQHQGTTTLFPEIIGSSPCMGGLRALMNLIAKSPLASTVMIRGDSGTGKELVARAIQRSSPRSNKPFVSVNCAAFADALLMSDLFGHEKGAFTGAETRRSGCFERADGGTLFLDEIGDITPRMQAVLLRVLQEGEFNRLGGNDPIRVDVRVIAATHQDLEQMVANGTFREDLYYRMSALVVVVPPLRDRLTDLPELCDHLLGCIAKERGDGARALSASALGLLAQLEWPGNVRQLGNMLRHVTMMTEDRLLEAGDFPVVPTPVADAPVFGLVQLAYAEARGDSLDGLRSTLERECVSRALDESGGNITKAADILGMKRPRLSQMIKRMGLITEPPASE